MSNEMFDDWFDDNRQKLMEEFIELYFQEKFNDYVDGQFENWKEEQ